MLLELQGVRVIEVTQENISPDANGLIAVIKVEPLNNMQNCPYCNGEKIIRNGMLGYKRIRHMNIGTAQCVLLAARQRYKCKTCGAAPICEYEFATGKERYTKAYKAHMYKLSIGSTVRHGAEVAQTPYSTVERFFKEAALRIVPLVIDAAQALAQQSAKLILGIDDFAIRKGHNYNTGIHDLRGENLIGLAEGRTLSELRVYMDQNPLLAALEPYAVVMDLAKGYHSFAAEFFPSAVRVADRFHVNGYIMDALNEVRRRISKELPPQGQLDLKRNKHLLNRRGDSLNKAQRQQLEQLLACSTDLRAVYELKEMLIDWYDLSACYASAKAGYQLWLKKGRALNIPEVGNALKTFENWRDEIVNYHRCRFTNGTVEGRNAKVKALQRRRFFVRNRTFYEALIFIECNHEIASNQFKHLLA
jgi:transposase